MIRARGAGDRDDIAMTRGEYERLRATPDRPLPDPVQRLAAAIEEAPDETWREQAACKGLTHLFYPYENGTRADYGPARKVCKSCPVLAECAEAMLDEVEGFVGGMSPAQRSVRRRRQDKRVHSPEVRDEAMMLARSGMSDAKVGERLRVHVRTVQTWRRMNGMVKDNHGRIVA